MSSSAQAYSESECLAYTLYKEANTEILRAKRAVYDVLLNRMRIRDKTACEIVKEKGQFSWYKRGMKLKVTEDMLTELDNVSSMKPVLPRNAQYFHNKSVKPEWARKLKRVTVIGGHTFYSEKEKRNGKV